MGTIRKALGHEMELIRGTWIKRGIDWECGFISSKEDAYKGLVDIMDYPEISMLAINQVIAEALLRY